jgi:hypothetical protein
VVNAAVANNVLISHKLNKEIPAPVEVFGLADEAVDVWVRSSQILVLPFRLSVG